MPHFSRRGLQMIIGVYRFLSNVNNSSVNVFITTINNSVVEASTFTMKYFKEASVLYMFLTLYIKWMNDIRLIPRPIHAPNHELEDTDINILNTNILNGPHHNRGIFLVVERAFQLTVCLNTYPLLSYVMSEFLPLHYHL
jgi:hypothetical protein